MGKYASGFFAIAGALVTALMVLGGQIYESKQNNIRHLRGIAYEAAIEEWKYHIENNRLLHKELGPAISSAELFEPSLTDLIFYHLTITSVILDAIPQSMTDEERSWFIKNMRANLAQRSERSQKSIQKLLSSPPPRVAKKSPNKEQHDQGLPDAEKN